MDDSYKNQVVFEDGLSVLSGQKCDTIMHDIGNLPSTENDNTMDLSSKEISMDLNMISSGLPLTANNSRLVQQTDAEEKLKLTEGSSGLRENMESMMKIDQCPTLKSHMDTEPEMITLDESIDKAIRKHLTDDYFFSGRLNSVETKGDENEPEKIPVQMFPVDRFAVGDSCRICRRRRNGVSDLKALCLEYPPYKRRLVDCVGTDAIFLPEKYYFKELEPKLTISGDQQVPNDPRQIGISNGGGKSSVRPMRLGLSKKAKLRPLHRKSTF